MSKNLFDDVLDKVGEPFGNSKGFEYGTHEVVIGSVASKEKKTRNDPAADVIEVEVFDENDEDKTALCTLYFHTEGGAKMSVAKILGIMVHNVPEEKKDKVRELGKRLFGSINDIKESRDIAVKLMNDKMVGKKAYLVAEPNGKYKTTSYGDLWHYPAEPESNPRDEEESVARKTGGSVVDDTEEIPDFDDL